MYDMLNGAMRNDRDYGLMQYLSFALVPFFPLFQQRGNERVERPKADWEVHTPLQKHSIFAADQTSAELYGYPDK